MLTQPGNELRKTVDSFTRYRAFYLRVVFFSFLFFLRIGSVQMVSKDASTLDKDYQTIRDLESHGFFVLQ
jgi:beta-xylosidase